MTDADLSDLDEALDKLRETIKQLKPMVAALKQATDLREKLDR